MLHIKEQRIAVDILSEPCKPKTANLYLQYSMGKQIQEPRTLSPEVEGNKIKKQTKTKKPLSKKHSFSETQKQK